MKNLTSNRLSKVLFAAIIAVTCAHTVDPFVPIAQAAEPNQTLQDYSVLPENLAGDVTSNPNVLIIVDNSGSMMAWNINDGQDQGTPDDDFDNKYITDPITKVKYRDAVRRHRDASSSYTNSFQVRDAMLNVLTSPLYNDRLNVGLMAFGQNRCTYDPGQNDNLGTNTSLGLNCKNATGGNNARGTNGLGQLRANIEPLTGNHLNKIENLLGLEGTAWNDDNIGFDGGNNKVVDLVNVPGGIVNGRLYPLTTQVDPANNDFTFVDGNETTITTVSKNGTPLAGSLDTAFRYLFTNDTGVDALAATPALDKTKFADGIVSRESGLGAEAVVPPSALQCQGPLTVILLTDGLPTQLAPTNIINGQGNNTDEDANSSVNAAIESARRIHYRGYTNAATGATQIEEEDRVKVHVIGFKLASQDTADKIAAAGGTEKAVEARTSADVENAFADIFNSVLETGATRSGLSVVTTPDAATGSFIQPSFTPLTTRTNAAGEIVERVTWTGDLRSFFIDRFGNFREDSDGNKSLSNNDKGFRILFSEAADTTFVQRFDVNDTTGDISNTVGDPDVEGDFPGGQIKVSDLTPVFSAADELDGYADDITSIRTNRAYTGGGLRRYLFSTLNGSDTIDFTFANSGGSGFNSSNKAILDLASFSDDDESEADKNSDAEDLIMYIRGVESNAFRNRTLNSKKLLLGDIVHSTPVQVDGPLPSTVSSDGDYADSFDLFASTYEDRRKMVYVGANDGILHAFSGGFWDVDTAAGTIAVERKPVGSTTTNFRLGAEVWGFVPRAVLPHLKFLRDPAYLADRHVSFVDGSLEAFNVKIFTPSAKYPNGWGTILVGGLRLGGAPYKVDLNGNGDTIDAGETITSSYFILDITDPESEPELLAELSDPDLNLTTSKPALVRVPKAGAGNTAERNHLLVFGSGPEALKTATNTSGEKASLFVYNLNNPSGLNKVAITSADANSFVGDISAADWNQDDIDDAVYFGTVAGTQAIPTGKLFRAAIASDGALDVDVLVDVDRAIQHEPVIPTDQQTRSEKYVLFGTGRTFMIKDTSLNYANKNTLYGVRESFDNFNATPIGFGAAPLVGNFLDTTGVDRTAITDDDEVFAGQTRSDVITAFSRGDYIGWKFELPTSTSRLSARGITLEELVFFSDFQPRDPDSDDASLCTVDGSGFLNAFDYRTGIFPSTDRLEFDTSLNTGESTTNALNFRVSSSLLGAAQIVVIGEDADGNTKFKYLAPGSNQEITELGGTLKPRIAVFNSGRKSWREIDF